MTDKLKKNLYYISWVVLFISAIILFRLLKIYDICCTILEISTPIIFGFIFAWILNPVLEKLENNFNKFASLALLIFLFLAFYALIIWKFIPLVLDNFTNLLNIIGTFIERLSKLPMLEGLQDIPKIDMDFILSSCTNIVSVAVTFVLVHIFGFYMLYNYDIIVRFMRSIIPQKYKRIVREYTNKLSTNMRLFIKGTLLDTLILFIISSILYSIIGLDYPIMLAAFSSITNIIPFVGPYIGGVPAILIGLSESLELALVTLAVIVIAQTVESNVINPMIMSKCIKVNPLFIVITLTIVGKFLGLFGMVFAVPILITLKLTLEFLKKYRKIKN